MDTKTCDYCGKENRLEDLKDVREWQGRPELLFGLCNGDDPLHGGLCENSQVFTRDKPSLKKYATSE